MTRPEALILLTENVDETQARTIARAVRATFTREEGEEWERLSNRRRQARHQAKQANAKHDRLALEYNVNAVSLALDNHTAFPPSPSPHPSPNPPSFPTSTSPQNPPIIPQNPETPQAAQGEDLKKKEAKSKRREQLTGYSLRLNPLFRRRPTTLWTDNEKIALAKLLPAEVPFPDEDFDLLLRFYSLPKNAFPIGRDGKPEDYRRHDMVTLLNNWSGEVGKAQKHFEESNIVPMQTAEQEERAEAHARRRRLFGS